MPNPKKHHTHSRTRMRRSQWIISTPNLVRCSQCGTYKLPHRICENCGYYKGELWVSKKEKTKEEEK